MAQKHPHIRCQMTEKSVFDLTQSGQALLLLTSHAYCLWVFSSSQPPGWPQYSKLKPETDSERGQYPPSYPKLPHI